jgi:hypothetical protein
MFNHIAAYHRRMSRIGPDADLHRYAFLIYQRAMNRLRVYEERQGYDHLCRHPSLLWV